MQNLPAPCLLVYWVSVLGKCRDHPNLGGGMVDDRVDLKLHVVYHRCPFPIEWLIFLEGFEEPPLTTGKL